MLVKCAWCGRDMGEKAPYEDRSITHSICPECLKKMNTNKRYGAIAEIMPELCAETGIRTARAIADTRESILDEKEKESLAGLLILTHALGSLDLCVALNPETRQNIRRCPGIVGKGMEDILSDNWLGAKHSIFEIEAIIDKALRGEYE